MAAAAMAVGATAGTVGAARAVVDKVGEARASRGRGPVKSPLYTTRCRREHSWRHGCTTVRTVRCVRSERPDRLSLL